MLCPIPPTAPAGSLINIDFFTFTIRHAKILSMVIKELGSVKSTRRHPEKIIGTACALSQQLEEWHASLPPFCRPHGPLKSIRWPKNWQINHVVYMQCAYYCTLMAIHSLFTNPWTINALCPDASPAIKSQMLKSSTLVAEASRRTILAANYIKINANSYSWYVAGVLVWIASDS